LRSELEAALQDELMSQFLRGNRQEAYEDIVEQVVQRKLSPFDAVRSLLNGRK